MNSYKRQTWLNSLNSPSTGNVVAFDGVVKYSDDKEIRTTFLSISDCHVSARLHKTEADTMEEFIEKMTLLRDEIDLFINHLKQSVG